LAYVEVEKLGKKRNQAYTEGFRKEAVKRSELTQVEVAKELGLSTQQYEKKRAEQSHGATRLDERGVKRLKSVKRAQRIVTVHSAFAERSVAFA